MTTQTLKLNELLGLKDQPGGGLAWHERIVEGFEHRAYDVLASHMGVEAHHVQELVDPESLKLKKNTKDGEPPRLSVHASNYLFRIAKAYRELLVCNGGNAEKAYLWLRNHQGILKGHIPVLLLQSQTGSDYVYAAIARMKPEPKAVESENQTTEGEETGRE